MEDDAQRPSPRPAAYHKLPIAQKRAMAYAAQREPAVACPRCDAQVMPADLLAHVEHRCTGPREPGPTAKWVTWREALVFAPKRTLLRWVRQGRVRHRGRRLDRQYLYRDLVVCKARKIGLAASEGAIGGT